MGRALALLVVVCVSTGCATRAPRSRQVGNSALVLEGVPNREFGQQSCGAGSLSAVFTFHGDPVSVDELDVQLPKADGGGVLSIDLLIAARERGYDARWVPGDQARIENELLAGRPVIVMLRVLDAPGDGFDYYHYVVIDGIEPDRKLFRFQFGDGETRWSPFGRGLRRSWRGTDNALLLLRPDVEARLRRAAVLEADGKLLEAEDELHSILASEPETPRAWTNLGNVLGLRGDPEAAEQAYRRALESDPYDAMTLNNLAWLLFERGDLEEAEVLARQAASDDVADLDLVLDTLGRILLADGRCASAAATFRRGLGWTPLERRPPARAVLLHGLALAHVDCGDVDGAMTMLENALDHDPDPRTAEAIRSSLARLGAGETDLSAAR